MLRSAGGLSAVRNSAGAATGIAGLGGVFTRPFRTVILDGDSIMEQTWVNGANYASVAAEGSVAWAAWLLDANIRITANLAVSGDTLQNIVNTRLAQTVGTNGDVVLCNAGTNDLYSGTTAAVLIGYLRRYLDAVQAAGKIPIYTTIFARQAASMTANLIEHLKYNDLVREEMKARALPYWDGYAVSADPTNVYGNMRANWSYNASPNQLHPNNIHAYYQGKALAAMLSGYGLVKTQPGTFGATDWASLGDKNVNLLDNPNMTGTGGSVAAGFAGTMPTGWALTISGGAPTGTTSIVDMTDPATGLVIGRAIEVAITFAGATDLVKVASTSVANNRITAGEYYEGGSRIQVTGTPTGLKDVQTRSIINTTITNCGAVDKALPQAMPEGFTVAHQTRKQVVPSGGSIVQDWLIGATGAGSATIRLWAPYMRATTP